MTYLPRLKRWLDEAKVKREYYRDGSKAREELEKHIADLELTIHKIEHPKPREAKSEAERPNDGEILKD